LGADGRARSLIASRNESTLKKRHFISLWSHSNLATAVSKELQIPIRPISVNLDRTVLASAVHRLFFDQVGNRCALRVIGRRVLPEVFPRSILINGPRTVAALITGSATSFRCPMWITGATWLVVCRLNILWLPPGCWPYWS
jgi:hypothetical protein